MQYKKSVNYKEQHRNSSIELLRIMAIIGVVILHYNGSAFNVPMKIENYRWLMLTEHMFIGGG